MSATTAKIAGRTKTENTGITPELANRMYRNLGSKHIALVEFAVAARTEGDDHSQEIKLDIVRVEPASDKESEDHMRHLERALKFKRDPQQTLTAKDPIEETVKEVLDKTGVTVLNCALCEHRYADTKIAHARGIGDDFPPCVWTSCGHVVKKDETKVCTKSHVVVEKTAAAS